VTWLLDTDVLSLLRRPQRHPRVVAWAAASSPDDLFLSVISLFEIERGAALVASRDPLQKAALDRWIETTRLHFADRVLPIASDIAEEAGRMSAVSGRQDFDIFIAATARVHALTVVTRNVRHYASLGVAVLDPVPA